LDYWLGHGALPSKTVSELIAKAQAAALSTEGAAS